MGYDLDRFTEQVDIDFQCPICHDVFENAVEAPQCQHVFCDQCIKQWLTHNSNCPMDKKPLIYEDVKPVNRILRNLLLKLKIKCEFEKQGCQSVITLENLQSHIQICSYDPNLQIKCEKNCGLMIAQKEHANHNCIAKLSSLMKQLFDENLSLKEKISELQNNQLWICSQELSVNNNNQIDCHKVGEGFAQSRYSLTNINHYFELKLVDFGEAKIASIGLTNKCLTQIGDEPKVGLQYVVFFSSDGFITSYIPRRTSEKVGPKWEVGDIIRVGIDFKKSITQNDLIVAYCKRNNQMVYETTLKSNVTTMFPSVFLKSFGAKLTVL